MAQHLIEGGAWRNETIVILKAPKELIEKFACEDGWTSFREPDRRDQLTAVAGLNKEDDCKELKLL